MAKIHLLGTGAALSSADRTTTMLAAQCENSVLVVDCGGDVGQRLLASDLSLENVEALFLTHRHADHVSGFPLFMEKLWLSQRNEPLPVIGPSEAVEQARRCFETFDTTSWDNFFEIEWLPVALQQGNQIFENNHWIITSAPGQHGDLKVIGLRMHSKHSDGTVTYSADTEPCDAIAQLAKGSDILIHEATDQPNHSSPADAARIAHRADAERLVMVHLPGDLPPEKTHGLKEYYAGDAVAGHDGDFFTF